MSDQDKNKSKKPKTDAEVFAEKVEQLLNEDNMNQLGGALKKLVESGIEATTKTANYLGSQISNSATKLPIIPSSYDQRQRALLPTESPALVERRPQFIRKGKNLKNAGKLFMVLGVGLGFLGIFNGLIGAALSDLIAGAFALFGLGVPGLAMLGFGNKALEKGERFKRYLTDLGDKTVIPVHDLAISVGKEDQFVSEELLSMCQDNTFKQGRLVENGQIFILDNDTYQHYKEYKREEDKKQYLVDKQKALANLDKPELTGKAKEVHDQGEALIKTLSAYVGSLDEDAAEITNGLIKSAYLILDNLEKHPQNAYMLDRFIDFYLPTSIKLVQKHIDFNKSEDAAGEHTQQALKEIEDSLSTLQTAFNQLLDNLNNEVARDVRSDISVLNTMLKQEGLLGKDFKPDQH